MFTAIVVKTRKVYRIFIHTFQENRTSLVDVGNLDMCPAAVEQHLAKLMAPKTRQIVTIFSMIGVQFIIISIWIIIHDVSSLKYSHVLQSTVCDQSEISQHLDKYFSNNASTS